VVGLAPNTGTLYTFVKTKLETLGYTVTPFASESEF
jgi:hypothetical protein